MKTIIIHTERIVPDDDYLSDWFAEMEKTEIPKSVLAQLKESGRATWDERWANNVITTYEISGLK